MRFDKTRKLVYVFNMINIAREHFLMNIFTIDFYGSWKFFQNDFSKSGFWMSVFGI